MVAAAEGDGELPQRTFHELRLARSPTEVAKMANSIMSSKWSTQNGQLNHVQQLAGWLAGPSAQFE